MPRIPIYQKSVQSLTPKAIIPETIRPLGAERAMNAQNEAVRNYGNTVNKVIDKLGDVLIEHQKMQADAELADADSAFRTDVQKLLSNDKGNGYLDKQLAQTRGATISFDENYEKLKNQYLQSGSDYQKNMLARSIASYKDQVLAQVSRHEAVETRKAYNNSIDSNLKLRVADAASITDSELLKQSIAKAQEFSIERDKRNGLDELSIQNNNQMLAGAMTENAAKAIIDQNPMVARNLLNSVKDKLSAQDYEKIDSTIKGKEMFLRAQNTWTALSKYVLPDGSMDKEKMQKAIFNSDKYSAEDKEKLWSYVEAKANEQDGFKRDHDHAVNTQFLNDIYKLKKENRLDDALKLAGGIGGTLVDQAKREEIVRKVFSNEKDTDPTVYRTLEDAVDEGKITKEELYQQLKLGNISSKDWARLDKELYKKERGLVGAENKDSWAKIKLLAESKITNENDRNAFLYTVKQKIEGKNPDEAYALANQLLEKDPRSGFFGWTQDQLYKTEYEKMTENSKALGDLSLKYSKEAVDNAVNSLKKRGKVIEPQYIEKVLSKYPNGLVP